MYENIIKIIGRHIEEEFEISKIFLFNICGFAYLPHEKSVKESIQKDAISIIDTDNKQYKIISTLDIVGALEKNPNIFDINILEKQPIPIPFPQFNRFGVIVKDKIFTFRVKIPKRLQKYGEGFLGGLEVEEFSVISNGSIFIPFVEIKGYPIFYFIGFAQEIRDIIEKQITELGTYPIISIPPNPLRENFFLILINCQSENSSFKSTCLTHGSDVLFLINSSLFKDEEPVLGFFNLIDFSIANFLNPLLKVNELERINREITKLFTNLYSMLPVILRTPLYKIIKIRRLSSDASINLSLFYKLTIDFDILLSDINKDKMSLIKEIRDNIILSKVENLFLKQIEPEITIHKGVFSAIRFIEGQLNSFLGIKGIIVGSILTAISALIGAAIVILFK